MAHDKTSCFGIEEYFCMLFAKHLNDAKTSCFVCALYFFLKREANPILCCLRMYPDSR